MDYRIGTMLGAVLVLLVALLVVLVIGKIPGLRKHPLGVHLAATSVVWIVGILGKIPAAAYLITLIAIWDYRRETKKPQSGWYRVGAGVTAIWLVIGLIVFGVARPDFLPGSQTTLELSWIFAVIGLTPWLAGWLIQWIRQGFSTPAERMEDDHS